MDVARKCSWKRPPHSQVGYFLPIELLHGVTFSLSRVVTVDFIQAALPDAWLTTGQQVLLVIGPQGIGGGFGALLGGWFMHAHGGKVTYQCAAIGAAGLLGFHAACCLLLRICRRPSLLQDLPDSAALMGRGGGGGTAKLAEPLVSSEEDTWRTAQSDPAHECAASAATTEAVY